MRGAGDLVPLVTRREQLLSALMEGPRAKSDVVGDLDVSRSTVDRSVRELEAKGLVERRGGGVGLTLQGRLLFEEYRAFSERCDGITAADDVLGVLDPGTDLDPSLLVDAEVVTAERTSPYQPVDRFLEDLGGADAARVLSTALSPKYVETIEGLIVDEGLEYTVGATSPIVERLVCDYRDALERALSTGRLSLRELAADPPFSLAVTEGADGASASVLVYADAGVRGYIGNDEPAAVGWAESTFRRFWTDGTPISRPVTDE